MNPKPKDYDPQYLRFHRLKHGLTAKELAERIGVVKSTITCYETGKFYPSESLWQCLKKVLGIDTLRTPESESIPTSVTFSFKTGHSYTIKDGGVRSSNNEMISPPTGDWCVFRYTGKKGIHHVFTEVRGGWTRTYTDAQLIGKKIQEAEHEQA